MRYAPPGLCLNDFAVLAGQDGYTVLHLQGPWTEVFDHIHMETSYGRASSVDLVQWEAQGVAFGVGQPGRFDQTAVWTMHPFAHEDGMAMLYTGVGRVTAEGWPEQAIGLARSDRTDGTGWRRHGTGPVSRADPRWYRTGDGMGWRDPFVVPDDEGGGWAMLLCASDASHPGDRSGCVALATSADLEHWETHPPPLSPGDLYQLECPVLEKLYDGWLLLGSNGGTHGIETWTAPRIRGPWQHLGPLAPLGAYAPRVVTGPDGARVVLHTVPRRAGLRDDGVLGRGMLAQPKVLAIPGVGPPRLEWWDALDRWLEGPVEDRPVLHGVADVEVDGPLEIVLRTLDGTPALTVGCDGAGAWANGPGGTPLARTRLANPPARLRVLTVGEYVEVYADRVFVLTALCYSGTPAAWTVLPERGPARPLPVRPVRLPAPVRDDASAVWPGPSRG